LFQILFLYWFPHSCSLFVQHELGIAADDGLRQLLEQSEGEVSSADKAAAMNSAIEKRAVQLRMKMGKLVAVANPKLSDGWLREVHTLEHCPYQSCHPIVEKRTE
jgi:hypothetical protein